MLHSKICLRWAISAWAVLLACVTPLPESHCCQAESPPSARRTDTVRAILAAEPAVVNIEGNKPSGKVAPGEPQQVNGMGSGVIIDSRGYILTNQHVVQDVSRIEVTLHNGAKYIGTLIDHDPNTDLALIKVEARNLPVIQFGTSSDLMRGEKVVAIGNPFGYQHTVTEGIISALHRNIPVNGVQEYEDLIQTDASINPGNSGGPLVNIDGEMIGLNAAVRVGAQGIGFAIPVDKALDVAARLISSQRQATLPFQVRTTVQGGKCHVSVQKIIQLDNTNQPTLEEGDLITSIGDQPVRNRLEYEMVLLDKPVDEALDFLIERDGQTRRERIVTRSATRVSLASARNTESSQRPLDNSSPAWNVLGLTLKAADAQQIKQVDPSYSGGLVIVRVRENSPAYVAQLRSGDILVGLMDWQTPNWSDLNWIFGSDEMKASAKPKFRIIRGKGVYYGTFDLSRSTTVR